MLELIDLKFEEINSVEEKINLKLDFGGCIRTMNILQRKIDQILFLNTYSDSTTAGIKIIDDNFLLKSFLQKLNFSPEIEAQVNFQKLKFDQKRFKFRIQSSSTISFFAMVTILKQLVQFI